MEDKNKYKASRRIKEKYKKFPFILNNFLLGFSKCQATCELMNIQ
jgi:hypothetical protein